MTDTSLRSDSKPLRSQSFRSVVKLLIAIGLIVFLFSTDRLDPGILIGAFNNPLYFLFGIVSCSIAVISTIIRWWILIRVQKLALGAFDALRLTMIGYFFNIFIPGGTGGDIVRAAYVIKESNEKKAQALSIAFLDRGLGLHALLLIGALVFVWRPGLIYEQLNLGIWMLLIFCLLLLGTLVPFVMISPRTNKALIRLCGKFVGGTSSWQDTINDYREQSLNVFIAYTLSVINAIFNVFLIHFMMLAVGSNPNMTESLIVGPLVIIANTLPISPGGLGVAEGASEGLYALLGQTGGANGMLLARFIIVMHALLGLPFFLLTR